MRSLLPVLLGDKWDDAVIVVRLLAFVPFLVAAPMYVFNTLMGLGRQRLCLVVTIGASLVNIACNLALIPRFDWGDAMASTLIAEGLSVVALWVLLRREVHDRAPVGDRLREM